MKRHTFVRTSIIASVMSAFTISSMASDAPHQPGCGSPRTRLTNASCKENTVCRAPHTKSFKLWFDITAQIDESYAGPTGAPCTNCTLNDLPIEGQVYLPPNANPQEYKVVTFLKPSNDVWYLQPDNKVVRTSVFPEGSTPTEIVDNGSVWGPGIPNNHEGGPQYSYSEIEKNGRFKTHVRLLPNVRYSSIAFALIQKTAFLLCAPGGEMNFRDFVMDYRFTANAQAVYDFGCFNKTPGRK